MESMYKTLDELVALEEGLNLLGLSLDFYISNITTSLLFESWHSMSLDSRLIIVGKCLVCCLPLPYRAASPTYL